MFKVILTGYVHNSKGEFVYTTERAADSYDAIIEALDYAAGYPGDFEGTVTAQNMESRVM